MKKILLFLLILSTLVNAQGISDYNHYSSLIMDFELSSSFLFTSTSSDNTLQHVSANITLFPRKTQSHQLASNIITSSPNSKSNINEENIDLYWSDKNSREFTYKVSSEIKSSNVLNAIDKKVKFPIKYIDTPYTRPSEMIDFNAEIRETAQSLARGEDDLYIVSYKVADWVEKNIKYDLSTLTADVVQPSSWVLKNKKGVCDELTNLFISMMRSLGVPARFVSGMAYTNIENKWGPHAWAEVYFPDEGWIPFDVTYGQFGWVDPSHIPLKYSLDSNEPSVQYSWRSKNLDMNTKEVDLKTTLKSEGKKIDPLVIMEINPLFDNVGPGSYVPFEVKIKNLYKYYLPNSVIITKAQELTEKNFKRVVLRPNEESTVYWITKIPEELDKGFKYSTVIEAEDFFHTKASSEITYGLIYKTISLEEANKEINSRKTPEEKKVFSEDINLECSAPSHLYNYEELEINCSLSNKGNIQIKDIQVCLESECYPSELNIGGRKEVKFTARDLKEGVHTYEIIAKNKITYTKDLITVNIISSPNLQVKKINYPLNIDYYDNFDIEMDIDVLRKINDINIYINQKKIIYVEEFLGSKKIVIHTSGSSFVGKNINMHITFKDENGKPYSFDKDYPINVHNLPWYINLIELIKNLF